MKQLASPQEAAEIMAVVGDAGEVAAGLARFREAAQALSSRQTRMIEQYARQWVAATNEGVLAADTLDALLSIVDARGVDRSEIIVRFIDDTERILIL
jgi:hypothetical protein